MYLMISYPSRTFKEVVLVFFVDVRIEVVIVFLFVVVCASWVVEAVNVEFLTQ